MEGGKEMTWGGKIIWLGVHSGAGLYKQGNTSVIIKGGKMELKREVKFTQHKGRQDLKHKMGNV